MTIEEARHLGKMEGIALGIMVLFRQDQILKPSEQIVNTEILGVGGLDLDALETFLNLEELNDKEKVSILIKYIQDCILKKSRKSTQIIKRSDTVFRIGLKKPRSSWYAPFY